MYGPMRASQQLGAVPGSNTLPGLEGTEPEGSVDGAEFASSGEAETAPRAGMDDYDTELTEEELNYARLADLAARQQSMNYVGDGPMNYVDGSMNYAGATNYDVNLTERDPGARIGEAQGAAISAQTRIEEAQAGSNTRIHVVQTAIPA